MGYRFCGGFEAALLGRPMRIVLVFVVSITACGPSRQSIDVERAALSAALDQAIVFTRENRACDAEHAAYMKTLNDTLTLMKAHPGADHSFEDKQEERAEAKSKMCESLLPSTQERIAKNRAAWDGWMDACLACASGRVCVDAERARRTWSKEKRDLAAEVAFLEEQKKATICGKR